MSSTHSGRTAQTVSCEGTQVRTGESRQARQEADSRLSGSLAVMGPKPVRPNNFASRAFTRFALCRKTIISKSNARLAFARAMMIDNASFQLQPANQIEIVKVCLICIKNYLVTNLTTSGNDN